MVMRRIKDLHIDELHEIVKRVKALRSEGHSYRRIVGMISDEYNVRLSKATVIRWSKGTHSPFNRIRAISMEPSPELSYIIGFYLGDGSIHMKDNGRYVVKLKVIDLEFAEEFANALEKLGIKATTGFERDSTRVDRFYVEGSNKTLFQLLSGPRKRLFSLAGEYPVEFLRGFFDSEGFPAISTGKTFTVQVAAVNSDLVVLEFVRKLLGVLGIGSKISKLYSKGHRVVIRGEEYLSNVDMFILWISRFGDVMRFAKEIGFTAGRKEAKLRRAIELKLDYPTKKP